jgi:FkbM family methyltransferase
MSTLEEEGVDLPLHSQETELEILKSLAPKLANRVMLDVGASVGVFAWYFASLGWQVHAFEPSPEVFAKLSARLAKKANVRCYPLALSDRDGEANLHIAKRIDGTTMDIYHSLAPYHTTPDFQWGGSTRITCRRLDSACAKLGIPRRPGVLKIDTAGTELEVLKGLGDVLPEIIMVEFWEDSHPFGKCPSPPHLMIDLLRDRGYRDFFFITRNGEEELVQVNTQHLRPGDWGNIIFAHRSAAEMIYAAVPAMVLRSQQRLLSLEAMYRTAAQERLEKLLEALAALEAERGRARALEANLERVSGLLGGHSSFDPKVGDDQK